MSGNIINIWLSCPYGTGETHSIAGSARATTEANLAARNQLLGNTSFGTGACEGPLELRAPADGAAAAPPAYPGEWLGLPR